MDRNPYLSAGQDTHCTPECCTCPRGVRAHLSTCPAGAGNVGTVCHRDHNGPTHNVQTCADAGRTAITLAILALNTYADPDSTDAIGWGALNDEDNRERAITVLDGIRARLPEVSAPQGRYVVPSYTVTITPDAEFARLSGVDTLESTFRNDVSIRDAIVCQVTDLLDSYGDGIPVHSLTLTITTEA